MVRATRANEEDRAISREVARLAPPAPIGGTWKLLPPGRDILPGRSRAASL
jgi:hypothetical protein